MVMCHVLRNIDVPCANTFARSLQKRTLADSANDVQFVILIILPAFLSFPLPLPRVKRGQWNVLAFSASVFFSLAMTIVRGLTSFDEGMFALLPLDC